MLRISSLEITSSLGFEDPHSHLPIQEVYECQSKNGPQNSWVIGRTLKLEVLWRMDRHLWMEGPSNHQRHPALPR